ncbi:MAG: hypothetical protein ACT4OM_01420 [Actinomycetota bacterium]
MSDREERLARNEVAAREINESIEDSLQGDKGLIRMVCECGRDTCERVVAITVGEYETVRRNPRHFVVAFGHTMPEIEAKVDETDRFEVVEKADGEPAEIAEEQDPRA